MENKYINLIKEHAIDNKYTKIYIQLIKQALIRIPEHLTSVKKKRDFIIERYEYCECHHIWPNSFFKNKIRNGNKLNLVYLSGREHFIAHWLLTKMFDNKERLNKMKLAFYNTSRINNKSKERHLNSKNFNISRKSNSNIVHAILIETDEKILVSSEEYKNNKHLYKTSSTGTITVKDKLTDKFVVISSDEYKLNRTQYENSTEGKVTVLNKETNNYELITQDEFYSNRSKYHYARDGKTNVFDRESNKNITITIEEFYKNNDQYVAQNKNKTPCLNLETMQNELILSEIYFNESKYIKLNAKYIQVFDIETNEIKLLETEYFLNNFNKYIPDISDRNIKRNRRAAFIGNS